MPSDYPVTRTAYIYVGGDHVSSLDGHMWGGGGLIITGPG